MSLKSFVLCFSTLQRICSCSSTVASMPETWQFFDFFMIIGIELEMVGSSVNSLSIYFLYSFIRNYRSNPITLFWISLHGFPLSLQLNLNSLIWWKRSHGVDPDYLSIPIINKHPQIQSSKLPAIFPQSQIFSFHYTFVHIVVMSRNFFYSFPILCTL